MIYLLAKYTILFVLASVLGFVLGYWWSRRNIVDVSESYEDLRKATERTDAANWERLWNRLDALPAPKETDLSAVFDRIDGVRRAVAGIPEPARVDLAPVEKRLESLAGRIDGIPAPVDIDPLNERLRSIETAVRNIPPPPPQQEVDLLPVHNDLVSIREQISGQPKVDLKPIDGRLRAIESEIGTLSKRLARPVPARQESERESTPRMQRSGEPKILSAALYGKKDDLKRISGVGPKLEQLLNKNGVYYFWQVASWSHNDIEIIDQRLDSFKGRISRDDWVSQAKQLKRSPGAASTPTDQALEANP